MLNLVQRSTAALWRTPAEYFTTWVTHGNTVAGSCQTYNNVGHIREDSSTVAGSC